MWFPYSGDNSFARHPSCTLQLVFVIPEYIFLTLVFLFIVFLDTFSKVLLIFPIYFMMWTSDSFICSGLLRLLEAPHHHRWRPSLSCWGCSPGPFLIVLCFSRQSACVPRLTTLNIPLSGTSGQLALPKCYIQILEERWSVLFFFSFLLNNLGGYCFGKLKVWSHLSVVLDFPIAQTRKF